MTVRRTHAHAPVKNPSALRSPTLSRARERPELGDLSVGVFGVVEVRAAVRARVSVPGTMTLLATTGRGTLGAYGRRSKLPLRERQGKQTWLSGTSHQMLSVLGYLLTGGVKKANKIE